MNGAHFALKVCQELATPGRGGEFWSILKYNISVRFLDIETFFFVFIVEFTNGYGIIF